MRGEGVDLGQEMRSVLGIERKISAEFSFYQRNLGYISEIIPFISGIPHIYANG